jgi:hypothetical protein
VVKNVIKNIRKNMSLVLRNIKGSELSYTEGDNNLLYLESLAMGLSSSITGLSFSYILGVGNETNGNDIVLSNGDKINADNGGGQLDLRYVADNYIFLGNNNTFSTSGNLFLTPDFNILSSNAFFIQPPNALNNNPVSVTNSAVICGDGNEISGRTNTIILALNNVTATEDDAVYVPNVIVNSGDVIKAASGGGQLDLRYGGVNNNIMLSTDAGTYTNEFLSMENGYLAIHSTRTGGGIIDMFADEYNAGFKLGGDGTTFQKVRLYAPGLSFEVTDSASGIDNTSTVTYLNTTQDRFRLGESLAKAVLSFASGGGIIVTQGASEAPSSIISSEGSQINGSVYNTVVLGGNGITATMSNTVYVPDLVASGAVVTLSALPTYADNAAAVAGGLAVNRVYKTSTGELRIVV